MESKAVYLTAPLQALTVELVRASCQVSRCVEACTRAHIEGFVLASMSSLLYQAAVGIAGPEEVDRIVEHESNTRTEA